MGNKEYTVDLSSNRDEREFNNQIHRIIKRVLIDKDTLQNLIRDAEKFMISSNYLKAIEVFDEVILCTLWLTRKQFSKARLSMALWYAKMGHPASANAHFLLWLKDYHDFNHDSDIEDLKDEYHSAMIRIEPFNITANDNRLSEQSLEEMRLQKVYDFAWESLNQRKYEQVIEDCLEMISFNKEWNQRAYLKLLLNVFRALGEKHPKVLKTKKRLAKILI